MKTTTDKILWKPDSAVVACRDLHLWWIEAHVINSATPRMDPAVIQSVLESFIRDVEADDQVELK